MSPIKSLMILKSYVRTWSTVSNYKWRADVETGAKSFGREKFGAKKEKANADVISGTEKVTLNCLQLSHTRIYEALSSPILKITTINNSVFTWV